MTRYAMVIDLDRCVGCEACVVSCKAEWNVPDGFHRDWVHTAPAAGSFPDVVTAFYVGLCNHCDHPTCVPACPTAATFQDPEGRVRVDRDVCIGCGMCVEACPYGARYANPVLQKVDKCDFCYPRTSRGEQPSCVKTCIASARIYGDLDDPNSEVHSIVYRTGARRLETSDVAIGPNVYYKGSDDQIDLVLASFPPDADHAQPPTAGRFLGKILRPLFLAAAGATFLGQAVAFFYQLTQGEPPVED